MLDRYSPQTEERPVHSQPEKREGISAQYVRTHNGAVRRRVPVPIPVSCDENAWSLMICPESAYEIDHDLPSYSCVRNES